MHVFCFSCQALCSLHRKCHMMLTCCHLLPSDDCSVEVTGCCVYLFALTWAAFCAQAFENIPLVFSRQNGSCQNDHLYIALSKCAARQEIIQLGTKWQLDFNFQFCPGNSSKAKGERQRSEKGKLWPPGQEEALYQAPNVLGQTWQAFDSGLNIAFIFSVQSQ